MSLERLHTRWKIDPEQLSDLEMLVVTFARMQGLTNESVLEQKAAERLLNDFILHMDEEDLTALPSFAETLGERNLRELQRLVMDAMARDLKEQVAEIEALKDWPIEPDKARDDTSSPNRTKPRDRSR